MRNRATQEIIYSMLTVAQRGDMHLSYATHLRDSATGDPATLAFHYSRSAKPMLVRRGGQTGRQTD
jgi:hypothetical protein